MANGCFLFCLVMESFVPRLNILSPLDLLGRTTGSAGLLSNSHVFGCPVYVLDPKLQGTSMLPKFSPWSRRGVFDGFLDRHSSTVPLVLNLSMLSITPQFHVVFDDWFSSVSSILSCIFRFLFRKKIFGNSDGNSDVRNFRSFPIGNQ